LGKILAKGGKKGESVGGGEKEVEKKPKFCQSGGVLKKNKKKKKKSGRLSEVKKGKKGCPGTRFKRECFPRRQGRQR